MKKPPRTELRGGRWWYRRRVPTELVQVLGFAEYRESLHTSDIGDARVKASIRDAEVTVELQAAKAQLKQLKATAKPPEKLSPQGLEFIREAVTAHTLRRDEEFRRSGPDVDSRIAYESILAEHLEDSGRALAFGKAYVNTDERRRVEDALQAVGVDVPSAEWEEAAFKAAEGYNLALQAIRSRGAGQHIPTPPTPQKPAQNGSMAVSGASLTLGVVIEQYVAGIKQSGYTRKIKRCLQLFGEVMGAATPVAEIKQKAVTGFMRDICRLPSDWAAQFDKGIPVATLLAGEHEEGMSPTTYRDNYRAPLKAFLTDARRDHGDEGFPALTVDRLEYVGTRKANEDQQRALHVEELKRFFEGPEFAAIAKDPEPEHESMYWFSVLALFTGARPRELCQVNPQVDCGQTEAGHWFIDLSQYSAAGEGIQKTIKTGEERRIPLHPELCRLGIPAYLERLKKAGADRLFPGFAVKKGNPFEASGETFTQILKDCGLYDDQAPPGRKVLGAYVLRKTFITQARNQGVVSKEITGHSDGTTTAIQDRHYIFGPEPFARKLAELQKFLIDIRIPAACHSTST